MKGWLRKSSITADMIGQKVANFLGAPVKPLAGVMGGVIGGVSGFATGAVRGGSRGAKVGGDIGEVFGVGGRFIGEFLGGIVGGAAGALTGAVAGFKKGETVGERWGEAFLKSVGTGIGFTFKGGLLVIDAAGAILLLTLYPAMRAAELALIALAKKGAVEELTRKSAAEARRKKVTGPTHSELAKDAPDHRLFALSSALAQHAVKEIGLAMKKAWALNRSNQTGAQPIGTENLTNLVDQFVSVPDSDHWWEAIVLAHSKR